MNTRVAGRLAALLAAAAIAAGCGSSGGQSNTTSSADQPASGPQTTLSAGSAHPPGTTSSRPQAARKVDQLSSSGSAARTEGHASSGPSAVSLPKPPVIAAGPLLTAFSGTGSEAIGALTEKTSVVLEWRTTSPPIQIFNGHGFLLLVSDLPSGRVRLARGDYQGLHVGAKGPWTIQIHAVA